MADTVTIWRVTGVIQSLADELDMLSRRKDVSLRLLALSAQVAVNTANSEIRKITGTDKSMPETPSRGGNLPDD